MPLNAAKLSAKIHLFADTAKGFGQKMICSGGDGEKVNKLTVNQRMWGGRRGWRSEGLGRHARDGDSRARNEIFAHVYNKVIFLYNIIYSHAFISASRKPVAGGEG